MDGILLIDKPKGWTSFDVVAKVRGLVRADLRKANPGLKNYKVGHTGTLDPAATGLLVLCLGKYTKKVETMIKHNKTYEVEMTLGATSTTGDQEGIFTKYEDRSTRIEKKKPRSPISDLRSEALEAVLQSFVGEQMQIPPAFSAVKVDGKRAYELARAGKEVKLEPRKCTIYDIRLTTFDFPLVTFTCEVSSGTYIRTLVEDIGKKLGIGAYMSELRRTKVAEYSLSSALTIDDLNLDSINERLITV